MPLIRVLLVLVGLGAAGLLAACDREASEPANDTAAAPDPAVEEPTASTPPAVSWNGWPVRLAGRVLVVPAGRSALRAQLVLPQLTDSTLGPSARYDLEALDGAAVELFSPAGLVGGATLVAPERPPAGEACTAWPTARVQPALEPVTPWTVAFAAGRVTSIPLEPVTTLSSADSARLVAAVARVASSLPDDPASPLHGLPFVVRSVHRFAPEAAREAWVADVVRRVNQEASAHAEQLFLVGERPIDASVTGYAAAYVERSAGSEETLELRTVLAAVRLDSSSQPMLVIARDYGDGVAFTLLERLAGGEWRARWSSAYAGC